MVGTLPTSGDCLHHTPAPTIQIKIEYNTAASNAQERRKNQATCKISQII